MAQASSSDGVYTRTGIFDNFESTSPLHPDLQELLADPRVTPHALSTAAIRVVREMCEYGIDFQTEDGQRTAAQVIRKRIAAEIAEQEVFDSTPEALEARAAVERGSLTSVVYYVDLYGSAVKIGFSTDILRRLEALRRRPNHLLALEPGGRAVEKIRHRQFHHDRLDREDFERSDRLLQHIADVVAMHGEPIDFLRERGRAKTA